MSVARLQALLNEFENRVAKNPIGEFFHGARRETAVRTATSVTFVYRPQTKAINPRLLAEEEREEIAKREFDSEKEAARNMDERFAGFQAGRAGGGASARLHDQSDQLSALMPMAPPGMAGKPQSAAAQPAGNMSKQRRLMFGMERSGLGHKCQGIDGEAAAFIKPRGGGWIHPLPVNEYFEDL